jgi:hypothetical protein
MKALLIYFRHIKVSFTLFLFLFLGIPAQVSSQVGMGTTLPNGALDVTSTTQGIVIPRIALTANNVMAPVTNPNGGNIVDGTIVFNTATSGTGATSVIPGFYYWGSSKWQHLKKDSYSFNVYGLFTSSAAQSITSSTGIKVVFGTTIASGGLITYDVTNRNFTLPAGKTYKIDFSVGWYRMLNGSYIRFALYDDTADVQISNSAHCESITNSPAFAGDANLTHFVTVGTTPLIVSVRAVGGNTTSSTLGDIAAGTALPTISFQSID